MSVHFANPTAACIGIEPAQIAALVAEARAAPLRRARLCLHADPSDPLHEMVIALCGDTYVAPHRHAGKSESFHLLAGSIEIVLFDDCGHPIARQILAADEPPRPRLLRLGQPVWHSVRVRGEWAVVHETTNGPFRREDTQFAPWAPAPIEREAGLRYLAALT